MRLHPPARGLELTSRNYQRIVCSVNMFHNCARQKCIITKTRTVVQERIRTETEENEVHHVGDLDDYILNLAQLHNAASLQGFQPDERYPGVPREEWLQKAVENRQQLDTEAEEKKAEAAAKRAAKGTKRKAKDNTAGPSKRGRPSHG